MSQDLKLYPWTFFISFFFYQSTALSSRAVNGHQMYSGGSVVGKASTTGTEISPITPPLVFTGGQNVVKFGVVFNITRKSLNFEPLAFEMQQDIQTLKQISCAAIFTKFGEVGSMHPWEPLGKSAPPLKFNGILR